MNLTISDYGTVPVRYSEGDRITKTEEGYSGKYSATLGVDVLPRLLGSKSTIRYRTLVYYTVPVPYRHGTVEIIVHKYMYL